MLWCMAAVCVVALYMCFISDTVKYEKMIKILNDMNDIGVYEKDTILISNLY